jgi:TRAP-type C4-dicarboxylate transport system substrate-binding protein
MRSKSNLLAGVVTTAGVAVVTLAMSTSAFAQKNIDLTAIDGYPPKASWVREFIKYYIPAINKRLAATGNYKVSWNQAWSGQIVKTRHVLEGLQKGLGDIGIVTTVFHGDKVPLQNLSFVTPFVSADPLLVSQTMDEMVKKFPAFLEGWKPYDQVYLTNGCVLDSYQMFTKEPVSRMSQFNGMKVAGAGVNLRYLQGLGAAGVAGSLVSFYNKLKTGVVSGAMLWPEAVVRFKIVEVAPYMLQADIGSMCSKAINMNLASWNKLPGEVRDAIAQEAIGYRDQMANQAVIKGKSAHGAYEKKGGKITKISAAEREAWAKSMPNVAKEWAASLEKKGIPGRQILATYMDVMRSHEQPIVRHWDRE